MAGSYYDQDRVKLLLKILSGDTGDDTILDNMGQVADQKLDNFLTTVIPEVPPETITNDLVEAASYYVCAVYSARNHNKDDEEMWMKLYTDLLNSFSHSGDQKGGTYSYYVGID